jgi:CrcB protein
VRPLLLVALGGALGSALRWGVTEWAARVTLGLFPWGTLAVNAAGSLAIGAVATLAETRGLGSPETRLLLVTGILGGFTTFSALSWETLTLTRQGAWGTAAGYALGSLVLGWAAAAAGRAAVLARP